MTTATVAWATGRQLAESLIAGEEAGLLHLRSISQIIEQKIRVWDVSNNILGIYADQGTTQSKSKINSDLGDEFSQKECANHYIEVQYQCGENGASGHWRVKDGEEVSVGKNNCLFEAICRQCTASIDADSLRRLTAEVISKQEWVIEEGYSQFPGIGVFLLGGAKYDGTDESHAKLILDNSQNTRGHGHAARAHPRGHSSHPNASGKLDSVENYSRSSTKDFSKSAWLSRKDQDVSMHKLLLTGQVQEGIRSLNEDGDTRIVVKVVPSFEIQMGLWAGGEMFSGPHVAESVTILLQHHEGMQNNRNAPVQVFTCYPVVSKNKAQITMQVYNTIVTTRSNDTSSSDDDDDIPKKKLKTH